MNPPDEALLRVEDMVPLSALGMAKRRCTNRCASKAWAEQNSRVGYAGTFRKSIVFDLRHASRMEYLEAALAALGLRLIVDVARAA